MHATLDNSCSFEFERREVLLIPTERGHSLGATLHLPQSALENRKSKILLIPGWSGPRTGPAELLVQLAARLAAGGHAVLRIDLHGRGDSTGRFEDGDLDQMIADASVAVDWLGTRVPPLTPNPSPSRGEGSRSFPFPP